MNEEHTCCQHEPSTATTPAAHPPGTIYTCPMHPEIERDQPGDCPICGMALEPKTISASSPQDDAELIDMTRRFWIGTALTLPVFLLAMSHLLPNAPAWLSGEASRWIQFALSTPVVLWAGWPFFKRGWRSLRTRNLNMFTLIAIGVAVAYFYSAAVMLFPGLFPASITHHGKLGIYFEAAAMITVLVLLAGKLVFLRENGVTDLEDLEAQATLLQDEGQTVIFVARGARAGGMIAVADPIKESTPEAVRELQRLGLKLIMLTGDNERTARAVAKKLGIDQVEASVAPEDKHERVQHLREAGNVVAMAGDGINDAPALAAADVGIAMGTGAAVAMESAAITLVKGDLNGIVKGIHLSRAVMRNIRQNLFFAFVYNALGIPIAAGLFYPFSEFS